MRRPVLCCLLLVLSACGDDDSTPKPPESGAGPARADAPERFSPDVLKELSARTVDGWHAKNARATDKIAQVTYAREAPTAKNLKLSVVVKIGVCPGNVALCYSTDPEDPGNKLWARQARDAMVRQNAKDAIASAESFELQGGRQALGLYRAGLARSADGKGTSTTLGMDVRHCNGANAIHMMIITSGEKSASDSEELSSYLSKDDAIAAAREVFAAFADKF
jgi:hypothetical protein